MKKKLLLVSMIVVLMMLFAIPVSAEDAESLTVQWFGEQNAVSFPENGIEGLTLEDQDEITSLLKEYALIREDDFRLSGISENTVFSYDEIKRIEEITKYEENANLDLIDAHISWQINTGDLSNNILTVDIREWTFVDYDDLSDDKCVLDTFGYGLNHTITFKKHSSWSIVDDNNAEIFREEISAELNCNKDNIEIDSLSEDSVTLSSITPYATYSASAAVAYADKWALSYNPIFPNYIAQGVDCANFVSQCLSAGGLPTDGTWYSGSYAWVNVGGLKSFLTGNKGYSAIYSPAYSQYAAGDVIMFGNLMHTMICVGKNSAGTPLYDAHTSARYHEPLSYYYDSNGYQRTDFYVIKMNGGHSHKYALVCDDKHPHKEYKKCSCGSKIETGNYKYKSGCNLCEVANVTIKSSKASYYLKEVPTFTFSGKNVKTYVLYLYRDGEYVRWLSTSKNTIKIYDLEPGVYTVNVVGQNEVDSCSSGSITFTILPENGNIKNEPTISISGLQLPSVYRAKGAAYKCGGKVTSESNIEYILMDVLNPAGELVTGKSIYPTNTRSYDLANFTGFVKFENLPCGEYTYVIHVKNQSGIKEIARHRFFVVNSLTATMSAPTISLDTNIMESGEVVSVNWNAVSNATTYMVCVMKSPWTWSDVVKTGMTKDTYFSFCIDEPGDYQIYVVPRDGGKHARGERSNLAPIKVVNKLDVSGYKPVATKEYNGKIYELYDNDASWRTANTVAKNLGGQLVSVTSANENTVIHDLIKESGKKSFYWIGATNFCNTSGKFSWTTGESFSYTNWNSNEPSGDREHWVMMYPSNGKWNDLRVWGSSLNIKMMGFIVEKNAPKPTPTPTLVPSVKFTDVKSDAYYATPVAWAVAMEVTSGTSATTFSPDNACTRGQAVTFLWRAAGKPAPKSSYNPFTDVKAGQYYYDAVLWAVENGITNGTSATTFSPDATCNRGQIVTFLYRAEGSPDVAVRNTFNDVESDAYYAKAVSWAVDHEVTTGTSATTFSPDSDCTRGQIVTFLYRAEN